TETSHGRYEVRLADERWVERTADVFIESNTTAIYPFGLLYHWRSGAGSLKRENGPLANRPPGLAWKVWQVSESSRLVYLQRDHGGAYNFAPVLLREGLDLIRGDRKKNAPTADASGNYETVRMRFGDIEVGLVGFDTEKPRDVTLVWTLKRTLDETLAENEPIDDVWVRWPEGEDLPIRFQVLYGYIYAPN